jgi:hypothetical protein
MARQDGVRMDASDANGHGPLGYRDDCAIDDDRADR